MRVLVEGQELARHFAEEFIDGPNFYRESGDTVVINHVGYLHSTSSGEVTYFLPKVFLIDNRLLGVFDKTDNGDFEITDEFTGIQSQWLGKLLILFYRSIAEFRKRHPHSQISESSDIRELSTNIGKDEYTLLDISLSILSFYHKHKHAILFKNARKKASNFRKVNWTRTVNKTVPLFNDSQEPIYPTVRTKNRIVDMEDELIIVFHSILNQVFINLGIPGGFQSNYKIYKGNKFKWLERNGFRLLKKIRSKYFSDTFKRMHDLSMLYLEKTYEGSTKKRQKEFIAIREYDMVFEDMMDKLFTDEYLLLSRNKSHRLQNLKNHKDGKQLDHVFKHRSLIDDSDILYIGDSKYYKPEYSGSVKDVSKQITYAKNIVQFNINLLNQKDSIEGTRYRDKLTEGYNITPNFLVFGFIPFDSSNKTVIMDYEDSHIQNRSGVVHKSNHFPGRLFDRDSLFVQQYEINFLFVLYHYTLGSVDKINDFRKFTKKLFRDHLLSYFNNPLDCAFQLWVKEFDSNKDLGDFVQENFRVILGKCISIENDQLIIAESLEEEAPELSTIIKDSQFKTHTFA